VVFVEDFYTVVHEVHEKELFHAGHHKTNEKIMSMYYGIPWSVVIKFTTMCRLWQPQQSQAPLKPIIAKGFMSRLQVKDDTTATLESRLSESPFPSVFSSQTLKCASDSPSSSHSPSPEHVFKPVSPSPECVLDSVPPFPEHVLPSSRICVQATLTLSFSPSVS
jgi:hypothetical protein